MPRQMSVKNRTWDMRSLISFQDVPLFSILVSSSFLGAEESCRRVVRMHELLVHGSEWPHGFDERAVVSGRDVRAHDFLVQGLVWPQAFDERAVVSCRRAVWAQARSAQPR